MTALAMFAGFMWVLVSCGAIGGGVLYGLVLIGWPDDWAPWRIPAALGCFAAAAGGAFSLGCASAFMKGLT